MSYEPWDSFNLAVESNKYQEWTRTTAIYPKHRGVEYCALGLTSEVGEVCDKLKKSIRDKHPLDVEAVKKELGDVAYYLARTADELGIPLGAVFTSNIEKLESRKSRDVLTGSGDDR